MREALKIDLEGNIVDVELVGEELNELHPISEQDPDKPEVMNITGYLTTKRVPEGTYKPVYDFDTDEFREGLTQQEIEAIKNEPQPETDAQKIARLESESVDTMLALAEIYEMALIANSALGQKAVDTTSGFGKLTRLFSANKL
ncbi:hypothetical protein [Cohnella herbarum]|uniref:Uncharacterized protein n=1 Tax=Cohnella herbarum TaxID=2728023 RepID=A0A7Z2VNR3_9BACL|nr:hypothetical protein [Cohnella herbarum]QJD86726.1 hypothetical protein HH215_28520 [Cohnella herbarum]